MLFQLAGSISTTPPDRIGPGRREFAKMHRQNPASKKLKPPTLRSRPKTWADLEQTHSSIRFRSPPIFAVH